MLVKIYKLIIFYFFIIIFLPSVLSLANSSNYSIIMFGTGMATGTPQSTNYNSTFLSEVKGTTRNAESNSYRGNIGFFENTQYFKTVSITSYSISPSSAVVGSTISLYISALNAQSVWAKITAPNGQQQTISLVNNQFVTYNPPSIVGIYNVTFYANSSTGAIASVIDYFELTAQPTPPTTGGGGSIGGGVSTTIEKICNYIWDCTPWSICRNGKQTRECKLIGECDKGIEIKKPLEEIDCYSALFDISLKLKNIELTDNRHLIFDVELIEKIGIDKIDVHIKYSIINKENYEIFSQIETKAIHGNLSYEKKIDEIKLVDGEYILRVDILYGNLQRAFAEQKFIVKNGKIVMQVEKKFIFNYFTIMWIILIILIILFILIILLKRNREKKNNEKKYEKIKKNKKKYFIYILFILLSSMFLATTFFKTKITGNIVKNILSENWKIISIPLIIIFIIIFLIILRKKIFLIYNKITNYLMTISKDKKRSSNSVSNLINKKVYSKNGLYIGKVKDIILEENRVDSLKIKVDNKDKFKAKGIIIKWNQIISCGEIVIVNELNLDNID